jgi:hypothetical protein
MAYPMWIDYFHSFSMLWYSGVGKNSQAFAHAVYHPEP